jgi:dTDP-4-amino-4,6-dideoxygalactose transaminase
LLAAKLAEAAKAGRLPKAVIPVHFAGQACDQEEFSRLAAEFGFTLIEDASHAIGAEYAGARIGACAHSSMAVFSFHPVKIITTGEGGMVLTNDAGLHRRLSRLRSHGITREAGEMEGGSEGPWYYQQQELGFNYRMTDIQAALGCSQLERIGAFVSRRRALAARYDESLRGLPLAIPFQDPRGVSAFHLYPIRLLPGAPPREQVFGGLRARGIGVNVHYIPIPAQPHYRRLGFRPGDFPRAAAYYAGAISLPVYADMTDAQGAKVIESLKAELLR